MISEFTKAYKELKAATSCGLIGSNGDVSSHVGISAEKAWMLGMKT